MTPTRLSRRTVLGAALLAGAALALPCIPAQARSPLGVTSASGLEAQLAALDKPIYIFESVVPSTVVTSDASALAISGDHAKVGRHSLRWDYWAGSHLRVDTELKIGTALPGEVDYFAVWLYNETAVQGQLTVRVGRGDRTDAFQKVNLDFTGWRAIWLRYREDFDGTPADDANRITMVAPATAGSIWIDQLVTNVSLRSDRPVPDQQVPNIWPDIAESPNFHWMGLLAYWQRQQDPGFDTSTPSAQELADAKAVYERVVDGQRKKAKITGAALSALESQFVAYGIPLLADPDASGDALRPAAAGSWVYDRALEVIPSEFWPAIIEISDGQALRPLWDKLGLLAAQTWDTACTAGDAAAADRAADLVLRLMVHLLDQGWALGSGQGTDHHIGYTYRSWAKSMLMLEPLLRERGLWERCSTAIEWYAGTGRLTYDFSDPSHRSGLIDVLNTLLEGLLSSCFFPDTWPERVSRLRAFRSWIDHAHSLTPGLDGGFKPDGTMYHHNGPYALYGRDALSGSVPVIAHLAGTTFALGGAGQKVLNAALDTQVLLANTLDYPLSQVGRQQTGTWEIRPLVNVFGALGRSRLDGGDGYDEHRASMFRRLLPKEDPSSFMLTLDAEFAAAGIEKAPAPEGYWALPYGATGLRRQDDWQVTVRSHNRYIWTTEIYDQNNLYGRYQTYGQISVLADVNADGWASLEDNGVVLPGYDWNFIPGATTKTLPFDLLKTDLGGGYEANLLSESAFGGSGVMDGQATLFGMKLKEHPRYDETHTARISALMVGNRIIALGSGVRNTDIVHPTRTTLFQVCPEVMGTASEVKAGTNWVVDPANNGYVVVAGPELAHHTAAQTTPDQSGNTQGTRVVALGYLDHGSAPKDSGYAYVLLVQGGAEATQALAAQVTGNDSPIVIAQRDRTAHVVTDGASGITAHVVFEPDTALVEDSIVRSTSRPALVLTRPVAADASDAQRHPGAGGRGGDRYTETIFSITDPDLHLYEGRDEDQYEGGTYVGEASPYTRPWQFNDSIPMDTTVVLKGHWMLKDGEGASVSLRHVRLGNTAVTVRSQHAASVEVTLIRKDKD